MKSVNLANQIEFELLAIRVTAGNEGVGAGSPATIPHPYSSEQARKYEKLH
jgi:hypothetical protein